MQKWAAMSSRNMLLGMNPSTSVLKFIGELQLLRLSAGARNPSAMGPAKKGYMS